MSLNSLLIVTGIVVGIGIVVFKFRKRIRLTFTRILHGPYSIEFFSRYKKFYIRSPYQYCFRDEFVAHILFALERGGGPPIFKSSREIYFEKTPYFISFKEFINAKGKPDCFNAFKFTNPSFIIKAMGYNDVVAGSKATLVYYFMNDVFFMGEYIFKNPRTNIKESLVSHFIEGASIEQDNFFIENSKQRIVYYQDTGFTVDIKYLTEENEDVTRNLNSYLNQVKNKKLHQEP